MVRSCEKGNGERSVEISGISGRFCERESRRTNENMERYSEGNFELIGVEESVALDQVGWRKIIASLTST